MNEVISKQLASVFFPVKIISKEKSWFFLKIIQTKEKWFPVLQLNKSNNLMNSLEEILANPLYKLLKIYSIPEVINLIWVQFNKNFFKKKMGVKDKEFSNYNWTSLEKRLFQMMISNSSEALINWGTTMESS